MRNILARAEKSGYKVEIVAAARPILEPKLRRMGLSWEEDAMPILVLLDVRQIIHALRFPNDFMDRLMNARASTAIKLMLSAAKPVMEPLAEKKGLSWEEVQSISTCMTLTDVRDFIADPEFAFDSLVAATQGPMAKRAAIAALRTPAGRWCRASSVTWEDLISVLVMVEDIKLLRRAKTDFSSLMAQIEAASNDGEPDADLLPAAKRLLIVRGKPHTEAYRKSEGVSWDEVAEVLGEIESIDTLGRFLSKVDASLHLLGQPVSFAEFEDELVPARRRLLLAKVRAPATVHLMRWALVWEEVVDAFKACSADELQRSIDNPLATLTPHAQRQLLEKLRKRLLLFVPKQGLLLSDVMWALEAAKDNDVLAAGGSKRGKLYHVSPHTLIQSPPAIAHLHPHLTLLPKESRTHGNCWPRCPPAKTAWQRVVSWWESYGRLWRPG